MTITKVTNEDIDTLKEIARRSVLRSVMAGADDKARIISDTGNHIDQNVGSNKCVFLKHGNGETMTFILVKRFWNLSDLFVIPEQHGKGIGSMLLMKAIAICENYSEKGFVRVNSSINAEGFYRKHGFDA